MVITQKLIERALREGQPMSCGEIHDAIKGYGYRVSPTVKEIACVIHSSGCAIESGKTSVRHYLQSGKKGLEQVTWVLPNPPPEKSAPTIVDIKKERHDARRWKARRHPKGVSATYEK